MSISISISSTIGNYSDWNLGSAEIADTIQESIVSSGQSKYTSIRVFDMLGRKNRWESGSDNALQIFFNSSAETDTETDVIEDEMVYGAHVRNKTLLKAFPMRTFHPFYTQEGHLIAQIDKTNGDFYVLYDVFGEDRAVARHILRSIFNQFASEYLEDLVGDNAWSNVDNRGRLIESIASLLDANRRGEIRQAEREISNNNSIIDDCKIKLRNSFRQIESSRLKLLGLESGNGSKSERMKKELDLIIEMPKVQEVLVKEHKLQIKTNGLYTYADTGERYYTGKYTIEVFLNEVDVRFFGDTKRGSFWSSNDPHPHVDGGNGEACLGNVGSTIIELGAQGEYYALITVAIDFLENANTMDVAGKNIMFWDMVDEDGKIIRKGVEYSRSRARNDDDDDEDEDGQCCNNCDEWTDEDEMYRVYETVDNDGDVIDMSMVCSDCCDHNYYYNSHVEEYVSNDCEYEGSSS